MIDSFAFETAPGRVVFGRGALSRLPEEVERLRAEHVLVLATAGRAEQCAAAAALLGSRSVGILAEARMHTPVEVTERALVTVAERKVDCLLAVGGGSTVGLDKAIALRTDLPQIVVPTTYAGSEMTDVVGETSEGVKTTKRSPRIRPEVVVYDVDLTLSVPPRTTAASCFNAIAHAVEALYAKDSNPLTSLMAEEGARSLVSALPSIMQDPLDIPARSEALYGAWLCACCLASAGMALHHKLCHTLGGLLGLPHAETHAILLPHALAYNAPAAPRAVDRLSRALGAPDPAVALQDLAGRCGLPMALGELGMRESDLDRAADLGSANAYWNPRPIDKHVLKLLLTRAFRGDRPDRLAN